MRRDRMTADDSNRAHAIAQRSMRQYIRTGRMYPGAGAGDELTAAYTAALVTAARRIRRMRDGFYLSADDAARARAIGHRAMIAHLVTGRPYPGARTVNATYQDATFRAAQRIYRIRSRRGEEVTA